MTKTNVLLVEALGVEISRDIEALDGVPGARDGIPEERVAALDQDLRQGMLTGCIVPQ